jgi:hypothetical protein
VFSFSRIATLKLIALNCLASPERRTLHRLTLLHSYNTSQTQQLHLRAFPTDDVTRAISPPSVLSPEYSNFERRARRPIPVALRYTAWVYIRLIVEIEDSNPAEVMVCFSIAFVVCCVDSGLWDGLITRIE